MHKGAHKQNLVHNLSLDLLSSIQKILKDKLVGFYIYGSVTSGDFDINVSDIDLLAVISSNLTPLEFRKLEEMHDGFATSYPDWKGRIEVAYYSLLGLKNFKTKKSEITVISPGEPLNTKSVGIEWLTNWYLVQEKGERLFGLGRSAIIPKISRKEYLAAVEYQILSWKERIKKYTFHSTRGSAAYAVLTLCRGLLTLRSGSPVSKRKAAAWASHEYPEWSKLIDDAFIWRQKQWNIRQEEIGTKLDKVKDFVLFATEQVVKKTA